MKQQQKDTAQRQQDVNPAPKGPARDERQSQNPGSTREDSERRDISRESERDTESQAF